jgi:hypothetical protein
MSFQIPATPDFPRFPAGNQNPYLAWNGYYRSLFDIFSRAPVLSQHGKGLLGPFVSPERYAALPGAPAGESYIPYPHTGDNPPAAAAAFSAWQWQMARFAQHQEV